MYFADKLPMKTSISILIISALILSTFSCSNIPYKRQARLPSSIENISTKSCIKLIHPFVGKDLEYTQIIDSLHAGKMNSYGIERIFDDPELTAKLENKIKKFNTKKRPLKKIRKMAIEIYLLANSDEGLLKSIINLPLSKSKFAEVKEKIIFRKWETELLTSDIIAAMKNLNLLKDPDNLKRVRSISGDIKETMKGAFYLSFLFTPKISFLNNRNISEEMLERLFLIYQKSNYNLKSIYPELVDILGTRASADTIFQSFRTVFIMISIPIILYFVATAVAPWMVTELPNIVEHLPEIADRFWNYTIPSLRDKVKIYKIDSNERIKMEEKLVNIYKDAYKSFKGKYPTDDSVGVLKKINEYEHMSDFNLLLEYKNAFNGQ